VSINQGVQVNRPDEINQNQDVTLRCDLRVYPAQLLTGRTGMASKLTQDGGGTVNTQEDFDRKWSDVTLDPGQVLKSADEGSNKPKVDWTSQSVAFFVFKIDNTCHKTLALGMETDCLKVFWDFTQFWLQKDCQTANECVVYVFIYPKTQLPIDGKWLEDADKDGFSNESETKVGTDPLDANAHP